jgi:hypothetical protein
VCAHDPQVRIAPEVAVRGHRELVVTVVVVLAAAVLWPASAAGAGGPKREVFAAGGWSETDQAAGTDDTRTVIASGPDGGVATIEYVTRQARRISCDDGSIGGRFTEGLGLGSGVLTIDRDLSHATLEGTVDLTTETWSSCGGDSSIVEQTDVPLSLALTGTGKHWRERTGSTQRSPSAYNLASRWSSRGRQATGTLAAGGESHATEFGDFGVGISRTHESTPGAVATPLSSAVGALPAGLDVGALLRAEAIWEHSDGETYEGVYLGADRIRRGDTTLYYQSYAVRPIDCGDGTTATVETAGSGSGPGQLDMNNSLRSGTASGTIDVTVETMDGCTGASSSTTLEGVTVSLSVTGTGPLVAGTQWEGIHVPSERHERSWIGARAREGDASITVGDDVRGSTWARLFANSWRIG